MFYILPRMADANNFDCLLCNEETTGLCFDDADSIEPFNDQGHQSNGGEGNGGSESDPSILLPCLSEECVGWMVERERQHLPREDYLMRLKSGELDLSLRCEALDWMIKACSCHNFGELCLYSAMNFLDRFLSEYNVAGGKPWAIQLAGVTCLLLAAKLNEVNVPSAVDLQAGDPKFLFEGKVVHRMEVLVLNCLKWNMKAYTPFDFLDYFLKKVTGSVQIPQGVLITRAIQIISSTIKGIDFLEFRPSEIAAAVTVYALGEIRAVVIDEVLSNLVRVEKDRVVKCLELVRDFVGASASTITTTASADGATGNGPVLLPVPHSPNGVLDAAFWSYKSGERSIGSCPSSSHTSPDTKRRKLDH